MPASLTRADRTARLQGGELVVGDRSAKAKAKARAKARARARTEDGCRIID